MTYQGAFVANLSGGRFEGYEVKITLEEETVATKYFKHHETAMWFARLVESSVTKITISDGTRAFGYNGRHMVLVME